MPSGRGGGTIRGAVDGGVVLAGIRNDGPARETRAGSARGDARTRPPMPAPVRDASGLGASGLGASFDAPATRYDLLDQPGTPRQE